MSDGYEKLEWVSQVLKIDDNGQPVPVLDPNGNQVYDALGNKKFEVIIQGSVHSAKRENHREEGIYEAHHRIDEVERENKRLRIELEMLTRAPGSSGVFFDDFSGAESSKFIMDLAKTDLIEAVTVGATIVMVGSVEGFQAFTQVTLLDDENGEDLLITAIDVTNQTITVQALTNAYKKGAKLIRSNVVIDTVHKEMNVGTWDTYSVVEVI